MISRAVRRFATINSPSSPSPARLPRWVSSAAPRCGRLHKRRERQVSSLKVQHNQQRHRHSMRCRPLKRRSPDYEAMNLTTGPHLLAHFRPQLKRDGVFTAKQLTKLANGRRVATAGAVIVRQRPGTAKGFVFLTLEDETGISQAIVKPDLFRDHRALIVGSPGLIVEGVLQNEDGQCSVRADKFWPLDGIGEVASHDFH